VSAPPSPYTGAELRVLSALLKARHPEATPYVPDEDELNPYIAEAMALVAHITGRAIPPDAPGVAVPPALQPVAERAVRLKTEQVMVGASAESSEEAASGRRLRSQSAGPWSESYFAPGDLGSKNGRPVLDPNAALDEALWALATPERREELIAEATGQHPPAGALTGFSYGQRSPRW
jgi:hypothetical protein